MEAFSKFADDLGLKDARVGIEVPSWYLNAHHYVRLKEILGKALIAEPSNLDAQPQAREIAEGMDYHRKSAAIAASAWTTLLGMWPRDAASWNLRRAAYQTILAAGARSRPVQ